MVGCAVEACVRNVVLLFSNPVWYGANTVPTTIIRNITALSSQYAYEETLTTNLTTLTTTNADTLNGVIQGLLYVPDIPSDHPCYEKQFDLIPHNVTRQGNLPPTNYNLIALAPWFNATCTKAYLAAARLDPIKAFIFYRPNNSTNRPQPVDSLIWDLDDDGAWQMANHFPVFAIPGRNGAGMMQALARYSGNLSQVPYGPQIMAGLDPNPRDYVRIWTELTMRDPQNLPAMWTYFLITIGATIVLIASISAMMHYVQRQRRNSLRQRIVRGEVDLEAMGIKRLTVPIDHVQGFPLFTYSYNPEISSIPSTPLSPRSPRTPRSPRRTDRTFSDLASPKARSHRHSMSAGSVNTEATNVQPTCHICLDHFEHRMSVIRELPCQHIFHPECIDEFLSQNSSLCPICKRSMLPRGYCPKITNGIVRRERAIRRLRERVVVEDSESEKSKHTSWGRRFFMAGAMGAEPPEPDVSLVQLEPPQTPKTAAVRGVPGVPPQPPTMPTVPEGLPAQEPSAPENAPPQPAAAPKTPPNPPTTLEGQGEPSSRSPPQEHQQQADLMAPKKSRRRRPRALQLQPPPPEGAASVQQPGRRRNPSAQTRQRMRTLAGSPFDDPDSRRSAWNRALVKVFPGFS